jgi:hypothetical protein
VEFLAALTQRMFETLVGTGAETVDGNTETANANA